MTGTIEALATGPAAIAAMQTRPELMAASEANEQAALFPRDPGGLSIPERLALASRIAALNADASLAARYRSKLADHGAGLLDRLADPAWSAPPDNPRLAAIQRHTDLVTRSPRDATRHAIAALSAAGLAEPDIVRLSQVIAFVNYQVRVLAGLRLIGAAA